MSNQAAQTSEDDDDEVETSLSDELNHSWPSTKSRGRKPLLASRTITSKGKTNSFIFA
jgi:hypothetical protein